MLYKAVLFPFFSLHVKVGYHSDESYRVQVYNGKDHFQWIAGMKCEILFLNS